MTTFHYWIQKHDFSAEDVANVTVQQAIAGWQDFDWAAELAAFDEADNRKNCPAGFGLHNGYDHTKNSERLLLHVCPINEDDAFLNYHYMVDGKVLGLFASKSERIESVERLSRAEVPELFRLFCAGRQSDLLEKLRRLQSARS